MYNINNVTLEEHNCIQLQLYLKLPKYKPFETLNKKVRENLRTMKEKSAINHDQKNLKTNVTHLAGSWTSSGISI